MSRLVEVVEIVGVERDDQDAGEESVGLEQLAGELDRPAVGDAAEDGLADEEEVVFAFAVDADVLAVGEVEAAAATCPTQSITVEG